MAQPVPLYLSPEPDAPPVFKVDATSQTLEDAKPVPDGDLADEGWLFIQYTGAMPGYVRESEFEGAKPKSFASIRTAPDESAPVLDVYSADMDLEVVERGPWTKVKLEKPTLLYFRAQQVQSPDAAAGFNSAEVVGEATAGTAVETTGAADVGPEAAGATAGTADVTAEPAELTQQQAPRTARAAQSKRSGHAPSRAVAKAAAPEQEAEQEAAPQQPVTTPAEPEPTVEVEAAVLPQLAIGTFERASRGIFRAPFPYELRDADGKRKAYVDPSALRRAPEDLLGQMVTLRGLLERDEASGVLVIRATYARLQ